MISLHLKVELVRVLEKNGEIPKKGLYKILLGDFGEKLRRGGGHTGPHCILICL